MDTVRVGIIGLGAISQLMHLPLLSKFDNVKLTAICDSDYNKARFLGEKYRVPNIFRDYQDLLALEEIDAVIIATPTNMHHDIAIAAIHAKKHCLVEKPLARTAEEAKSIVRELENTDVKLMVGMNQRFRPDAIVLKSFIHGGEIGDVFYIKAGWLQKHMTDSSWKMRKEISGGGVFLDLGVLLLDLSLWLLDFPKALSVSAMHFDNTKNGVEDFSTVSIKLDTGMAMTIETGWNFDVDRDLLYCNVYGNEGLARVNPLKFNKKIQGNLVNVTPEKIGSHEDIFKRSYYNELKHFIGAVTGLTPLASTGKEAIEKMRIVDAIYESARLNREILLT